MKDHLGQLVDGHAPLRARNTNYPESTAREIEWQGAADERSIYIVNIDRVW